MKRGPSFLLRAGLLLVTVALVGGLVGFAWEHGYHEEEAVLEEPPEEALGLPQSPQWREGLSEAERAIVQRATQGLPPYKSAVPQPLAADYLGAGSPIAAAWFMTRDTPAAVLDFYERALMEAGLPLVRHRYNVNAGYVGYMEPHTRQMHTVSVLAQGEETAVFVSSGQVASFVENPGSQVPPELPLPPETERPLVLSFQEEGRVRHSVIAEVLEAKMEDIAIFYQSTLKARGWKPEQVSQDEADAARILVTQGDARVSVLVQRKGLGVRLYLTLDAQP